ncbi:hypothetical protein GCM10008174_01520 [Methylopila turkensis]|uniref:Uncharacterized protein n=2 Tax=Methylopila turkensis TaxID=1437816 RepID=A0A9W6JL54_9HYPH|nr:hypothetical protein GCM10008174_01520 [Methylopila turkensis]
MPNDDSLETRRNSSLEAKKQLLAKFRSAADDPEAAKRAAERKAILDARNERERIKEAARQKVLEEERRIAAEEAAKRAEEERIRAVKAEEEAARFRNSSTAMAARALADMARGVGYPARKNARRA